MSNETTSEDGAKLIGRDADWLRSIGGTLDERRDHWYWTLATNNRLQWQRGMVWVGHPRNAETPAIAVGIDRRTELLAILAALKVKTEAAT